MQRMQSRYREESDGSECLFKGYQKHYQGKLIRNRKEDYCRKDRIYPKLKVRVNEARRGPSPMIENRHEGNVS